MPSEYERFLLPKGNVFAPSAEAVAKLALRLQKDGFLPAAAKGHAVKTIENTFGDDVRAKIAASLEPLPSSITAEWLDDEAREDVRLVFPVRGDTSLKYPLSMKPDGEARYDLEIHRASDFVYPVSDSIDAIDTACRCGEDLAFEWDEDEVFPAFRKHTGIFTECEACSRTFDPSQRTAAVRNPIDGSVSEVRGGAAYRFALVVNAGERFVRDARLAFAPDLVALVEEVFGRSFYEVASLG